MLRALAEAWDADWMNLLLCDQSSSTSPTFGPGRTSTDRVPALGARRGGGCVSVCLPSPDPTNSGCCRGW